MLKEALATALSPIISASPEDSLQLIDNFETADLMVFQSYFDRLPLITFSENNSINDAVHIKEPIGDGAFGSVFKNEKNPFVYKIIKNTWTKKVGMEFLKPVFREVAIQTLLQSDKRYGHRICRIYRLYRMENSLVLQLEPLECTLDERIESQIEIDSNIASNSDFVSNLIREIYAFLTYFESTYGFCHSDLHRENIMTVRSGDPLSCLKLIDFGQSYVNFEDVKIGNDSAVRLPDMKGILRYFYYVSITGEVFSVKLTTLLNQYNNKTITTAQFMSELQTGGKSKKQRTRKSRIKKRRDKFEY